MSSEIPRIYLSQAVRYEPPRRASGMSPILRWIIAFLVAFGIASAVRAADVYKWRFAGAGDKETPSVRWQDGGILQVAGDPDGGTVSLEWYLVKDPVTGLPAWIPITPCDALVAVGTCEFRVGSGVVRVMITGHGASMDLAIGLTQIRIGAFSTGGGDVSFDLLLGGESLGETFDVGTGSTLSSSGGVVHASGLTQGSAAADTVVTLKKVASSVNFGAKPTASDPHIFFDGPSMGDDGYIWFEDSVATWSGLNFVVGGNRWLVKRGGAFQSESAVGISGSGSNLTTAVFRPHTSYNVGLGGIPASGLGALVANGTTSLVFAATYVQSINCKFWGSLAAAPGGATECDTYYDTDNQSPCVHTGAGFVQVSDLTTACS